MYLRYGQFGHLIKINNVKWSSDQQDVILLHSWILRYCKARRVLRIESILPVYPNFWISPFTILSIQDIVYKSILYLCFNVSMLLFVWDTYQGYFFFHFNERTNCKGHYTLFFFIRNPFIRTSTQTFPGIRNWYSHFCFSKKLWVLKGRH